MSASCITSDQAKVARILNMVAARFKVPVRAIRSRARPAGLVLPRHVAMWLARQTTAQSYPSIGLAVGGRDHKTVIHGVRKVQALMAVDEVFAGVVVELMAALGAGETGGASESKL